VSVNVARMAAPPDFRVPAAQLTIAVDEPGDRRPGETVRQWFAAGFADLGGDLADRVRAGASRRDDRAPGVVAASVLSSDGLDLPWSTSAWQQFLQVASTVPALAALEVHTNDDRGRPGRPFLSINCTQPSDDPRWRILTFEHDDPAIADTALVRYLRSAAEVSNPSYGEISYTSRLHQSALETGLALLPHDTVPRSRRVARGYAWVTVLAEELGDRLGGVGGLLASGAFTEVTPLTGGGFWLRSTEHWRSYGPAEAERVFRALAPVLPPGRPTTTASANPLADEDPRG
jgi:hypothetical protein